MSEIKIGDNVLFFYKDFIRQHEVLALQVNEYGKFAILFVDGHNIYVPINEVFTDKNEFGAYLEKKGLI